MGVMSRPARVAPAYTKHRHSKSFDNKIHIWKKLTILNLLVV